MECNKPSQMFSQRSSALKGFCEPSVECPCRGVRGVRGVRGDCGDSSDRGDCG
eukprot:CAMPEP_0198572286 /NCGR_PEP_ID=MMETSP1462-20131121/111624_1 /TAXON_ID=1333877 /ORGANISM="Brandtodinium nutriculum, Strain RCC3387" /LENGTH=52 /DNA_ID=CAMNT_0044303437 /DNA_START=431 /DNA_END=585 /DNA_ORIENTATION=-